MENIFMLVVYKVCRQATVTVSYKLSWWNMQRSNTFVIYVTNIRWYLNVDST